MSRQPSSYDDISVADSDGESIKTCISPHSSPQRKPSPLPIDDRILRLGGQTFATNLRASYLKSCKNSRPPHSGEIRLLELVRENAAYRHEIHFFRAAYQAARGLVRAVNGIDQEMILQYYLEPTRPGCRDEAWLDFSSKLEDAVDHYQRCVADLEQEWVSFWHMQTQQPAIIVNEHGTFL